MRFSALPLAFLALTVVVGPLGAIPATITYQGSLKQSGTPYNGTQSMTFKIYDALTGGTLQWTGTQSVNIKEGLYRVELTPDTVDWGTTNAYLETCIGTACLSPREKISSTPYALVAKDLAAGATIKGDLQINGRTTGAKTDGNTSLSSEVGTLRLQNTSSTPNNFSGISYLESNGNQIAYAGAQIGAHSAASASVFGDYVIATKAWGVGGSPVERIRVDSKGDLKVNGRATAAKADTNAVFSAETGTLRLQNTSSTPNNFSGVTYLESNGNPIAYAGAQIGAHSAGSASIFGDYVIATKAWGVGGFPVQRVRVDSKGNVSLGYIDASQSVKVDVDNKSFYPAANQQWSLGRAGNLWTAVWALNGTIQSSSSRLKKEIREISIKQGGALLVKVDQTKNGVETIQSVASQSETFEVPRGIIFKWKNATGPSDVDMIGFMGDDLPVEAHAILPDGSRDPENFYTSSVIGILCAKVRQQDARAQQQDDLIKKLEMRLSALEGKGK